MSITLSFAQSQLLKRIKSLLWRALMMAVAAAIAYALQHLADLNLPIWVTGILGLFLGEVSKYVNNVLSALGLQA